MPDRPITVGARVRITTQMSHFHGLTGTVLERRTTLDGSYGWCIQLDPIGKGTDLEHTPVPMTFWPDELELT